jgi:hypothetical protein
VDMAQISIVRSVGANGVILQFIFPRIALCDEPKSL